MLKIITDVFMYIFEAIIVFNYSEILFEPRFSKVKSTLTIFALHIILMLVYFLKSPYLNGLLLFIFYTIIFSILYKNTLKASVFHSTIFISVMLSSELITLIITITIFGSFGAFLNKYNAYLFTIITSKLLYFSIIMILLKLFAIKENKTTKNNYFWLLLILPVSSIMIFLAIINWQITYSIDNSPKLNLFLIISGLTNLFANAIVFLIYEYSIKNLNELNRLKTISEKEKQDLKYFEVIEQSNKDMRIFSHDIKNHLTQIRNIDNIEDVQKYIDKLMPTIDKFSYMGMSKNKMLDLIISKYYTLCESKNIKFSIDAKTANLNYIDDIDLSTLMNNLLDNAIEAAEKTSNKFIDIRIFSKNEIFDGLIIRNSCDIAPVKINGKLKTTKQNATMHGIGTSSIKRILHKYDAIYDWKYLESYKIFETNIVFSKKQKQIDN